MAKTATAQTAPGSNPSARVFNFGSGPAAMPLEVLEKAKRELVTWHDAGMSVMEMSHRGEEFVRIAAEAEADLRTLLAVPAGYKVLFLQGAARRRPTTCIPASGRRRRSPRRRSSAR
jgi:phosphoserine aminotransferase